MPDHMQDQILGGHPFRESALHLNPAHLQLVHGQALTGQHVAHLTGSDPEGDRTECSMRGGV